MNSVSLTVATSLLKRKFESLLAFGKINKAAQAAAYAQ